MRLRSHQIEQLSFFKKKRRALSLLSFGSGKTQPTLVRLRSLIPPRRALIVTTASTMDKWAREVKVWGHPDWVVTVLHGRRKVRWKKFREPHHVAVINYEGILVLGAHLMGAYDIVIFDELHRVKNPFSKTSRAAAALGASADYVYGLTGSPVLEHLGDMFGVVRAINPQVWGTKFMPWRRRYFKPTRKTRMRSLSRLVPKPGAEEELRATLHDMSYYKPRDELDVTYPREVRMPPIDLRLNGKARRHYLEVENDFRLWIKGRPINVHDVFPRLQKLCQLARGWVYVNDEDDSKKRDPIWLGFPALERALQDYFEEVKDSAPVIVWAVRPPELRIIESVAGKSGLSCGIIDGGTPVPERTRIMDDFNRGRIPVLAAQPRCIGEGVDLQAGFVLRFSYSWSHQEWSQSDGRASRMSSYSGRVIYSIMRVVNTVDEVMIDAVQGKRELLDRILNQIVEERVLPWDKKAKEKESVA